MPKKSPKICNTEKCRQLAYDTYCDKCKKDTHKEYKEQRVDKKEQEQAFYSSSLWIKLRNRKKRLNPLCEVCLEGGRLTPVITLWK